MIYFKDLMQGIDVIQVIGNIENLEVLGIEFNSKEIKDGYAFLAIEGYTVDGHEYISNALDNGAKVIICEKLPENLNKEKVYVVVEDSAKVEWKLACNFYGNPTKEMSVFGITGTNGKTTVSKMVHELTKMTGKMSGYAGTIGIEFNNEYKESKNTTGSPLELQKTFRKMLDSGIKDVSIEVSSHAIVLERIKGVEFSIGGFTNLSQDHLDFHKTMEDYSDAKKRLFSEYVNGKNKFSIINIDDKTGRDYSGIGCSEVIGYSLLDEEAELYAFDVELSSQSTKFKLKYADLVYEVKTNLVGEFNVYNSLCAMGVMISKGYEIEEVVTLMERFKTVNGRMEYVENRLGRSVYVDYAHTPDGIENVLKSVNEFKKGKSIIVFGCGGDRDKAKRPMMATIAEKYADVVFITSDNPRTEKPETIIEDILAGIKNRQKVRVEKDREMTIIKAFEEMENNDVLVIAGKGHENYQIIGREKKYFSDAEVVRKI